jgi:dihydropyrimidinase
MATTLIKGGTVVSATGRGEADVLIDGETIAAVLAPGSQLLGTDVAASVDTVIDATGKYVIPGGIDAHTHMELPFGGTNASDTFETGTRAAAWGGTTSIIDFAVQRYGERVQDGLAAWHEKAAGNCAIDYGFHQIVGGVDDDSLAAMRGLVDEGVSSFKLFMAYPGVFYSDDAQVLKAMQVSQETGLLTMMHAENGPAIDVLAAQLAEAGKKAPYYHGIARAWQMEEEATHRAIMLANLTRAGTCSARRVRSTCTSRWRSSWVRSARSGGSSRAPSGCARRRCAAARRATSTTCGRRCAPTTSRWSRPTTARSA